MNRIILESRFIRHQKTHLILVTGLPVLLLIIKLTDIGFDFKDYVQLIVLFFVFTLVIISMFFKRGFLKKKSELYRGLYCFGKLILKKKISLNNKDQVSILKFRKTQKMAWFSNANPDLALTFQKSDVTLLNEKHTKREMLISLVKI